MGGSRTKHKLSNMAPTMELAEREYGSRDLMSKFFQATEGNLGTSSMDKRTQEEDHIVKQEINKFCKNNLYAIRLVH